MASTDGGQGRGSMNWHRRERARSHSLSLALSTLSARLLRIGSRPSLRVRTLGSSGSTCCASAGLPRWGSTSASPPSDSCSRRVGTPSACDCPETLRPSARQAVRPAGRERKPARHKGAVRTAGGHAPSVICQTLPMRSATPYGLRSPGEYLPTGSGPGMAAPDCCFGQCVPSGGPAPRIPTPV